jgi:DnaK suppressor protein
MPKKQPAKSKKQTVKTKMKLKVTKTTTTRKQPKSKPVKQVRKVSAKTISPREKKVQEIRRKLLEQKKSLLIGAIETLNELPGPTVFPDLGDQATAEIDRNFMLRLRGRERKLLKKIDEAIERIDQNVFGICERCGEPIHIRRLEARPVTTMCIECKILEEEEEKLREA